jgi:hypothetical protein
MLLEFFNCNQTITVRDNTFLAMIRLFLLGIKKHTEAAERVYDRLFPLKRGIFSPLWRIDVGGLCRNILRQLGTAGATSYPSEIQDGKDRSVGFGNGDNHTIKPFMQNFSHISSV